MTYDELVTSMAGMIEITRSGAKASRAVVTLSSRYAQMTDEASSTGAKLTEFYDSLGIKTRDADGQLVDFYKVLEQMGEKWGELDDDQRKYYANIQAGANQSQNLLALLNNWDSASKINATAKSAWDSDSAEKANENYMNSLEGKINGLKSAWQQLSRDFMNSGMLKGLITIATKILEIADHVGALGTIIGVVFAYKSLFALATFMETAGNLSNMLTMMGATASKMGKEIVTAFTGAEAGAVGTGAVIQTTAGETGAVVATEAEVASDVVAAEATKAEAEVVASAETAGAAATQAGAEAEAAGVAGASGFSKFLAMVKFLAPALALVGLGVAAIEIDKYLSFDKSIGRMKEAQGELDGINDRILELNRKRADGGLTQGEKRELRNLKMQRKELEAIIKLENRRALKAAHDDLKKGGGKKNGERAGTEKSATYDTAEINYLKWKKEYDGYAESYDKLMSKKQKGIALTASEEEAMEKLGKKLDKAQGKMDEYEAEMGKAGAEAQQEFLDKYEAGLRKKDIIDPKELKNYEAQRSTFLRSMLDPSSIKDDFQDMVDTANSMFDKLEGNINARDVDLTDAETALDVIKEMRAEASEDTVMSFDIKDKDGNSIETVEGKLKDLTDEQLNLLINAEATGDYKLLQDVAFDDNVNVAVNFKTNSKEVKKEKEDIRKPVNSKLTFASNIGDIKKDKDDVTKPRSGIELRFSSNLGTIESKVSTLANKIASASNGARNADGKPKGMAGGLSWLGDEGSSTSPRPELVVTNDGAYLAGTTGWELHNISASDRVYSYSETKKLLGRGGNKLNANSMGLMPRYAKGKKSKKEKKREEFERKLATLDYKRERYHWSDEYYNKQYAKLAKKYKKYTTLSQKRDQWLSKSNMVHDNKMDSLQNATDAIADGRDLDLVLKKISDARKYKKISLKEEKELKANAYKSAIDYYTKEYLAGKKSYADLLKVTKSYWSKVGEYSKEYYESLDALREAEIEKVTKEQETYSDKLEYGKQYASLQIRELEKQKELRDKEKERIEDAEELVDLQNSLSEARAKMVRVYKEGVGWVYEADSKAVKDAQKDLDDYFEEHADDSLQAQIDKWQEIADLYDDIEAQSELFKLAQKLGINNMYDLVKGDVTDVETMANWIKSQTTWVNALDAVITNLENMTGKQYRDAYLDTGVTQSAKDAQYNKYNYDNVFAGTRSTGKLSTSFGKTNSEYIEGIVKAVMTANEYVGLNKAEAKALAGDSIATTFNIDNISLPNVSDAKGFELSLRQWALQNSYTKA